jgi:hypothetical protein
MWIIAALLLDKLGSVQARSSQSGGQKCWDGS